MFKCSLVISTADAGFDALAFKGDFEQGIRMAKEIGYDAVEIAIRDPNLINWKTLKKILDKEQIAVSAIGTGQAFLVEGLSLSSNDLNTRKKAVERVKRQIEFAQYIGGLVIIGLMRGFWKNGSGTKENLLDSIKQLGDFAVSKNVSIVIEPLNRYECDNLNTITEVLEVIEEVALPNVGVLADTFHMNIEEPSIEDSIRKAKNKLFHFHVADSNRWAPGSGHINFKSIFETLKEIDYSGYISVECMPLPGGMERAARLALETIKSSQ